MGDSKKMKILHIIDSLGLGGAQTVVKGIFETQKDNKDIFLFALRTREITTEIDHKNVFLYSSKSKYSLAPLLALKKLVEKEKIDILHCHLFRSNVFGWLLKVIWFPRIKLVIHEHGGVIEDGLPYKLFLKISRRSVDLYIAVSKFIRVSLTESGVPGGKVKLLYNFVDTEKFNRDRITWNIADERKKLGIPANAFVVGFAGRLTERKGWREFVQAAAIISKQGKSIKFLIAGDGADRDKLLKLIAGNGLQNQISFLGRVQDMTWFYSLLDCFVIPSHYEPMGITELEAMAMQVPVVASNVPALNEIIKDEINGILFDVEQNNLAEKITLIRIDTQLRGHISKNCTEDIQRHNLVEYLNKLQKVYAD
jgi:L-malate glycosyltransferase